MLTLMKPNLSMRVLPRSALAVCLVLAMTMLTGLTSARAQDSEIEAAQQAAANALAAAQTANAAEAGSHAGIDAAEAALRSAVAANKAARDANKAARKALSPEVREVMKAIAVRHAKPRNRRRCST